MKIVYIGSFNPITLGHVKIMDYVLKSLQKSTILVVPSSDLYDKKTLDTSFLDRYNMIKIAVKDYKNIEVSDIEDKLSKKLLRNPKTIETLKALNEQVMLLIGSDNYLNLDSWYEPEELIKNFKIIVYPRGEFNKENLNLYKKYKDRFIFLDDANIFDISSTEVRFDIKSEKDTSLLLNKEVLKYINEHKLYK